jgi:hypothetical protein
MKDNTAFIAYVPGPLSFILTSGQFQNKINQSFLRAEHNEYKNPDDTLLEVL